MSSRLAPLQPLYLLVGDEIFFRDRFRAQLAASVSPETREFGWLDEDLSDTPLEPILDLARTPSLMAPHQVIWIRNVKELFGRGEKKHGDFPANLRSLLASRPAATLVFIADHLHLPADRQRIALEDKTKMQRILDTLGSLGEVIECAQASPAQAATLARQMAADLGHELAPAAAQQLAERLDGNLGLAQRELEKLSLYAGPGRPLTAELANQLIDDATTGNVSMLTAQLARGHRAASLACFARIWADEGDSGAIGLVFQLSRTFEMALILRQENVRDRGALYRTLPEGLRPPGFAADAVLQLARQMPEPKLRAALPLLHAADVELRSSPPSPRLIFERFIWTLTAA